MSKNYRASLSACLGDPVDGNPTGVMQEAAFAACGQNARAYFSENFTSEVFMSRLTEQLNALVQKEEG